MIFAWGQVLRRDLPGSSADATAACWNARDTSSCSARVFFRVLQRGQALVQFEINGLRRNLLGGVICPQPGPVRSRQLPD